MKVNSMQSMRIFKKTETKKKAKGKTAENVYYWASISDKDKHGEWISANVFVRMSKAAAELFDEIAEETKNPAVSSAFVKVTDAWLKAVPGNDHNNIVLFVNEFEEEVFED